jgi:hypothetical protein
MRALCACVWVASGCLYIGEVNHAPTATLAVEDAPAPLHKGTEVRLRATIHDQEDGDRLPPMWSVEAADGSAVDPRCDYRLATLDTPDGPRASVTFYRPGAWVVAFDTKDRLGAPSNTSRVMLTVVDAPPRFTRATAQLVPEVARDPQCSTYVAGQPLPLRLSGDPEGEPVTDEDAQPDVPSSCTHPEDYVETLRYTWRIVGLPASSHAVIGPRPDQGLSPCPSTPPAGLGSEWTPTAKDDPAHACLYPDVGGANYPDMYQVGVFVSDGTTEVRTDLFAAAVRADLPPCLAGVAPPAGSLVVDRDEVQRFLVTGVIDDLDPFSSPGLTFAWSIWRERDPVWRAVPSWTLPSYTLDPAGFGVGERVRVRVEPLDRTAQKAACDPDDDVCGTTSCLVSGNVCQEWVTWDLELR